MRADTAIPRNPLARTQFRRRKRRIHHSTSARILKAPAARMRRMTFLGGTALSLLCGAPQSAEAQRFQVSGVLLVVPYATATEPTSPDHGCAHEPPGRSLVPIRSRPTSVSRTATARHDLRQEPGAVVPLAGICAGGLGKPRSLPQTVLDSDFLFEERDFVESALLISGPSCSGVGAVHA